MNLKFELSLPISFMLIKAIFNRSFAKPELCVLRLLAGHAGFYFIPHDFFACLMRSMLFGFCPQGAHMIPCIHSLYTTS